MPRTSIVMVRDEEDFSDDDDLDQDMVAEDGDAELLHEAALTDDPKDVEVGIIISTEKCRSSRQYRGTVVNLSEKSHKFCVLCSWYESTSADTSPSWFSLEQCEDTHTFIPVISYICILTHGCFKEIEREVKSNVKDSVTPRDVLKPGYGTEPHSVCSLTIFHQSKTTNHWFPQLQVSRHCCSWG